MVHDVIVITEQSHPTLFKAFELISHDCGRQAGHTNYCVPDHYDALLPLAEQVLAGLLKHSAEEFETLCIGEQSESQAIVQKYGLLRTDELLQRFFEEFC